MSSLNLIMKNQPIFRTLSISLVLVIYMTNNVLNLAPYYQRPNRWNQKLMNKFIETIMTGRCANTFYLYKYQPHDKEILSGFKCECIDGHHRLTVIQHYCESIPVKMPNNKKPILIVWEQKIGSATINVFYKESIHTKEWIARNPSKSYRYLTHLEIIHFDDFILSVAEIIEPLEYKNRISIFKSFQDGVQMKNSDLYKSYIHIPLINYMKETNLNNTVITLIQDFCIRNASESYFVHWYIRMYLISKYSNAPTTYFSITDAEISNFIEDEHPYLESSEKDLLNLSTNIEKFYEILSKINKKLGPIPFFALFAFVVSRDFIVTEVFIKNMREWIKSQTPENMKLWVNNRDENTKHHRIDYFNECIENFNDFIDNINDIQTSTRKQFSKEERMDVWLKTNNNDVGSCYVCKDIIDMYNFEACHIISKKNGGNDELDNLVAGCIKCNRRMGTENLETYKNRIYPEK